MNLTELKEATILARDLERKQSALEVLQGLDDDQQIPPQVTSEVALEKRKALCLKCLIKDITNVRTALRKLGVEPDPDEARGTHE